jgi:hypothetical protein
MLPSLDGHNFLLHVIASTTGKAGQQGSLGLLVLSTMARDQPMASAEVEGRIWKVVVSKQVQKNFSTFGSWKGSVCLPSPPTWASLNDLLLTNRMHHK